MNEPVYKCRYCRRPQNEHAEIEDAGIFSGGIHRFEMSDFDKGYKACFEQWRKSAPKDIRAL